MIARDRAGALDALRERAAVLGLPTDDAAIAEPLFRVLCSLADQIGAGDYDEAIRGDQPRIAPSSEQPTPW